WPGLKGLRLEVPGFTGAGFAQPAPCDQAEDHGAKRGNETQREVAAVVVHEGMLAREEVQEPLVEAVAEIVVFVPVRGESSEIVHGMVHGAEEYAQDNQDEGTPQRVPK